MIVTLEMIVTSVAKTGVVSVVDFGIGKLWFFTLIVGMTGIVLAENFEPCTDTLSHVFFLLGWADTPAVRTSMPDFHRKMGDRLRSAAEGADTLVWLCLSPDATKQPSGGFFQDRKAVKKHLPLAWTTVTQADESRFMEQLEKVASGFR